MSRRYLRVTAPFAAFRWLQAGVYRATSPVMPPSTAYGLVMNLAGVETRDPENTPITRMRSGLPAVGISVGLCRNPGRASLYQQLHSYPVGSSGKELALKTKGAKYWITPVRRELLVDLEMVIGVEAPDPLLRQMEQGLRGEAPRSYGLPFMGDNNLLPDKIEILQEPVQARWYERLGPESEPREGSCRLTVWIDRENSSLTQQPLFAPSVLSLEPPALAWVQLPPST